MKKIKHLIGLSFGILILSISSCDIVEGPYMIDGNINTIDTVSYVKKVLIEDFTGHRCPNCPEAAEELAALQQFYGENVIGIAIHPHSTFSIPNPTSSPDFTYDFRNQFADEIDDIFNITNVGLPRGMINRTGYESNHQLGKDQWANIVQTELTKEPIFGINISSNVSSGNGIISVNIEALTDINEQYNVVVCLTENGIIEWQKDNNNGDMEDYIHNHVLRTILNSSFGESIGNSFTNGDSWTKDYSVDISSLENVNEEYSLNTLFMGNGNCKAWNEENMEVVVYIYKLSNYEITQAEEIHLNND